MARGLVSRKLRLITSAARQGSVKPQQARKWIRRYHVLNKLRAQVKGRIGRVVDREYEAGKTAGAAPDSPLDGLDDAALSHRLGQIDGEVASMGGLEAYQRASTSGQDGKRGGDSSRWLMQQLGSSGDKEATALEIGCLSPTNLISTSGYFARVDRLDLHSQHPSITQQDFMERPVPRESERYSLVLCLLVLNFVPTPQGRGDMLKRTREFLQPGGALFLVLPLPCVANSRYTTQESLEKIMESLGYRLRVSHEARKVCYWLWDYVGGGKKRLFPKKVIHDGKGRNNFCIVL